MKTMHVYFSGRVQGVGFRYTTRQCAVNINVCGWVRNLPDGRVEMMAQGDDAALKQLLMMLKNTFESGIEEQDVTFIDHPPMDAFVVKH